MSHTSRKSSQVSATDIDVLCSAYREMVGNAELDETLARQRARDMVRDLTGIFDVDDEIITRMIRR